MAEARDAQGELDQAAKEDPAKVLAGQKEALAKAEGDMAALQAQALAALDGLARRRPPRATRRARTAMVGSEESMRAKAGAEAQKIFDDAKDAGRRAAQGRCLPTAMAEWEAAKDVLAAKFKADLKPSCRSASTSATPASAASSSGCGTRSPACPAGPRRPTTKAETNFGDGVIAKLTRDLDQGQRGDRRLRPDHQERPRAHRQDLRRPAGVAARAGPTQEQAKFDGQLDQLHNEVIATRDNFNKDLIERSSAAVDEVRAEIAELRKKAGGLVGRIVNAINRFIDDPVKFIIEGLLELLGIPPAAFWAVVAKIKKVVKDIADDPMRFANNLLQGLAEGFGQFFDNFGTHLLKGFLELAARRASRTCRSPRTSR